ncbi:hypothetical protein NQ317_019723, partial [Molorchus minor]
EVVTEFVLLYNRRPEIAIGNLLQLCVDVCGYQNFNISNQYHFKENAATEIINLMESNEVLDQQENLKKTGKYLFMEPKTLLAKVFKISIYNFLHKLILFCHERKILYDEFFSKHLFLFVKAMAFSEIRAIRHTGVIFGLLMGLLCTPTSMGTTARRPPPKYRLVALAIAGREMKSLHSRGIQDLLGSQSRLQDNKTTLMRVECVHELSIWIKYFPKIFITQLQAVNYLCKLITDMRNQKDVRYAALETFEMLARTPGILTILRSFLPDFSEAIGKRFYDVDIKVAIKAIDIFTIFLKMCLLGMIQLLLHIDLSYLLALYLTKFFLSGEAAARFITYYLQTSEENEQMVLKQLAKFSMKPGYATKQLLVEGCLHNCPAIQNWEIYINILLYDNIEMDIKQALVEMFAEAVYQVLEGTSSIKREMSPKGD